MKPASQEIEVTLVVQSDNPKEIVRQVAALDSIGDYQLLHQESKTIHDIYMDTPGRALQNQGFAMRLRGIGSKWWLTLKGPPRVTELGAIGRFETEAPWSQEVLDGILKELAEGNIKILIKFDQTNPLGVMTSSGLEVIQDREDYRQVRNIIRAGGEDPPILAEMAIDSVIFHSGSQDIRHYEVEIEAKKTDFTVLGDVMDGLLGMYKPNLRKWNYGKLTTGQAIERMLSEGTLRALVDPDNNLKPAAYRILDYYMQRGGL